MHLLQTLERIPNCSDSEKYDKTAMKRKFEQLVDGGEGGGHGVSWIRGHLLGKGGYGSVYFANLRNPKSRSRCFPSVMAVKSAEVSDSTSLQKEKEVFNVINGCPYILTCFGEETTCSDDGQMVYNVLLEYAAGGTLSGLIRKNNGVGLPEEEIRRYTRCILEGIDYIHRNGYVHCDLKPENILLVDCGDRRGGDCKFVAKIGDFGLAKRSEKFKRRKLDPYLRGTALYLAPEVVVDHVQESPSDIWALGCVVFEMLTGKHAWDLKSDATTDEVLKKIGDRLELPKIPAQISKDGKDFLKGCLVRKPSVRFTAEMLLQHPFVSGLGKIGEDGECSEISNSEDVLSEVDVSESSTCSISEGWAYSSEEGSSLLSWEDDAEESYIDGTNSTTVKRNIADILKPLPQVSSNLMQKYPSLYTIPAGA